MINRTFIEKYNIQGPRYTSYPPANFFHNNMDNEQYIQQIIASNEQTPQNISLYIHIPFCSKRCHFCGCNNDIAQKKSLIRRYVDAIKKEIQTVAQYINLNRPVSQIHWGGGTPNSISNSFIEEIMDLIKSLFLLNQDAEIAMECSPAYLSFQDIDQLAQMGFNRLSLGIQDFRTDVLKMINRDEPKHPVYETVNYLKQKGFKGINLDFVYGLPLQTPENFQKTLEQAIEIQPDRIVTFSYAHVPWVKSAQKQLETVGLPKPEDKISMLINSVQQLKQAGYVPIGIDHFAKPDDDLTKALENQKLHRNFQGYCTLQTTGQVYGFGTSSISQLWGAYVQNDKNTNDYIEKIEQNGLAVQRGYLLNNKEQITRSVINSIMCNGVLKLDEMAESLRISTELLKKSIGYHSRKFKAFENDEILEISENGISLSEKGRMVARNVAMILDPYYKQEQNIYSKTV